jgi:hypothetical protein
MGPQSLRQRRVAGNKSKREFPSGRIEAARTEDIIFTPDVLELTSNILPILVTTLSKNTLDVSKPIHPNMNCIELGKLAGLDDRERF